MSPRRNEWERGVWRPRAVAAEKPAVENTPPVAPQASSADPSGTYEDRRGLGGRPGGRPRGAVGGGVRNWPTLTGCDGCAAARNRSRSSVPRAPPGGRTASSFIFLNPLLQNTRTERLPGTLFAAAPAPERAAAPQAWCCGSRGLAATLRRDQDRSSAATEPYSCIKVLFSPLLRRRGA